MLSRNTWQAGIAIVGFCIVGYFLYRTVEGDRGWIARMRLQDEIAASQETLDALKRDREALEHRVLLMRPERVDPDLLEEEARKTLNYSKPNEIIILTPPDKDALRN